MKQAVQLMNTKLICKLIIKDMKDKMDASQFANQKGVSFDHYLIKMIDKILSDLDKKGGVQL